MSSTNHNPQTPLTITKMVYNRLPFLVETANNDTLISNIILEVCYELDQCFKIGADDPDKIGDEQYYNMTQKMVIADLVAVFLLMLTSLANMQGNAGTNTTPSSTYIKTAKAGSAEITYEAFNINTAALFTIKPEALLSFYKKGAVNKAMKMGCFFDLCDDCSIQWKNKMSTPRPFIVFKPDCGCK